MSKMSWKRVITCSLQCIFCDALINTHLLDFVLFCLFVLITCLEIRTHLFQYNMVYSYFYKQMMWILRWNFNNERMDVKLEQSLKLFSSTMHQQIPSTLNPKYLQQSTCRVLVCCQIHTQLPNSKSLMLCMNQNAKLTVHLAADGKSQNRIFECMVYCNTRLNCCSSY